MCVCAAEKVIYLKQSNGGSKCERIESACISCVKLYVLHVNSVLLYIILNTVRLSRAAADRNTLAVHIHAQLTIIDNNLIEC